jgi:hypothetical protein
MSIYLPQGEVSHSTVSWEANVSRPVSIVSTLKMGYGFFCIYHLPVDLTPALNLEESAS